jgi:large subunit ribosomal protein L10
VVSVVIRVANGLHAKRRWLTDEIAMSKIIKQMEMDALKNTFKDVRDLVVLSSTKLSCKGDYNLRASLRKKSIRVQMVKNSLARRVFDELGMQVDQYWGGSTLLAWGSTSLADLSKELEAFVKKNDKTLKVKGAIAEGQPVSFQAALRMPTRAEAAGRVVGLAMSPASRLISQFAGPGASLASQLKTLCERKPEGEPAAVAAE